MHQQAIKTVRQGQSVHSVAASFGVNVRSIYRWLADFDSGGQNALLAKPIPGRPAKVGLAEMRWLAQAARENTPLQYQFEFGLWTVKLITELLRRRFGKKLSLAAVSRIMNAPGFTAQKPLYQVWQQDATLVRQWVAEIYQATRALARAAGGTTYLADEPGIRSEYHTGSIWALRGQTPIVEVTGRRFALNMISTVSPRGEFHFMVNEGSVTDAVFRQFLGRVMIGPDKPVFAIADRHPIHRAKLVKSYVESPNGRLELFNLPPYALHRNPDEQAWAYVKGQVSKRLVQRKDEMKRLALGALCHLQRSPQLIRSFFR